MDARVIRLEVIAEQTEKRLDRIETQQGQILSVLSDVRERLAALPTRTEFEQSMAGVRMTVNTAPGIGLAVAFGAVAVFIAVLAHLRDQKVATRPDPLQVIRMPAPQITLPPAPAPGPGR